MISCIIKFPTFMHKIFDNMLTDELKHFFGEEKEGRDFKKKEEKRRKGWRTPNTMTYPTL